MTNLTYLKERVLIDDENKRNQQIAEDRETLISLLLEARIIDGTMGVAGPIDPDLTNNTGLMDPRTLVVTKRGQVRFYLDNVIFHISRYTTTEYLSEGGSVQTDEVQLRANRKCANGECHRMVSYPYVLDVKRPSDLLPLFNSEPDEFDNKLVEQRECGWKHDGTDREHYDDREDLQDLPF